MTTTTDPFTSQTCTTPFGLQEVEKQVDNGLDFIISLFPEPVWPRTISTKTTENRQVRVCSKQQAMAWYKGS